MKVLIVKTSSLGDVIHTLPALTDAIKNIPDISFDWVVEEAFAEIPLWHKAVKNVIPVALRRMRKNFLRALFSGELFTFTKKLRQEKYDLVIDAQGLMKSALIATFAHGTSNGYNIKSIREKIASIFYKKKFAIAKDQHAITRIRQLFAAALKYEAPTYAPDYGINTNTFLPPHNSDKYLIFFHGTSRADKSWSEQKWIDLAHFAAANGFTVYLPRGNTAEFERAKHIAKNARRTIVLSKLNLSAIASLLYYAKGAVAVDTGLGHLSAALGIPTVSLYGPTDPKLIGTVGKNQIHMVNFDQVEAADVWHELSQIAV